MWGSPITAYPSAFRVLFPFSCVIPSLGIGAGLPGEPPWGVMTSSEFSAWLGALFIFFKLMKATPASSALIFLMGTVGAWHCRVSPLVLQPRGRDLPLLVVYLSPRYLMQQSAEVGLAPVCLFVCVRHLFPAYLPHQNRLHQAELLPFDSIC